MCTVTFVPVPSGFILTSSRDESTTRPTLPPAKKLHFNQYLYYPLDSKAGGSWFAVNETGRTGCILNGAFEPHHRKEYYRRSRGLILMDSFSFGTAAEFWDKIDLTDVEPFTMISHDSKDSVALYEFKWDGSDKFAAQPKADVPGIWSSVTLYDEPARNKRQKWFNDWLVKNREYDDWNILKFHSTKHGIDDSNDVVMQRGEVLKTLSITQYMNNKNAKLLRYYDLMQHQHSEHQLKSSSEAYNG